MIIRIKLSFLIVLLLLSVTAVNADPHLAFTLEEQQFIKDHPVIVVGGEEDWPPYDFVENGEYTGAGKDYLAALEKYTGLTFDIRTGHSWQQLLEDIRSKQLDVLPVIFWNKQRASYLNYTDPYLLVRQYFFVHEDAQEDIESISDLYGKTLAIPKGYAQIDLLNDKYPNIHIVEVADPLAAIDAVITSRADALIENTALIRYLIEKHNIQGIKPIFASNIGINNIHMGIRKDWPILRDILQKGLNAITQEEKAAISKKWISFGTVGADTLIDAQVTLTDKEQHYLEQKKIIKACVDPNWMPIEGIQNGQYTGMGADYLAIFQEKINVPIEVVPTEIWTESIAKTKSRKCDIFVLSLNVKDQQDYMDISTPYLTLPVVIATKQAVPFISSDISEVSDKPIGMVEGYLLEELLEQKGMTLNFVKVPSIDVGLKMVAQGKLFGYMDAVASINYAIYRDYYGELKVGGKLSGIDWNLSVATRNDEPELAQIVEKILLQIPEQSKQRVINDWVSAKAPQGFDYDLFWKIMAVFSVILIMVFARNRQLVGHRKEIKQKNNELTVINSQLEIQKNEIQHLAYHDFLTNLPNRKNFMMRLEHAIDVAARYEQSLAILFLDLDRFKNINDSLGHHVGDMLLQLISTRLKDLLRDSDTIARLGGDEFVILLEGVEDLAYPSVVAERILASIRQPIIILNNTLNVSASVGLALYPNDGDTSDILIKNADSAMYLAKERGKDQFQYYTEHLSAQIERRLVIEQALQYAEKNQQLTLCYQSQLDLKQQKIIGAEALLRWNHPELGNISPDEFIPIAEESGLIIGIGEWVFRNACQEFVRFQQAGHELESLSINVSSVQFNQKNLPEIFKEIIDELGISAKQIEIEITERYIMEDSTKKLQLLDTLRQFGFRISVDDFGTGYSSMAYLKRLPVDIIKIDKSFISDIPRDNNDVQITKAILALSHSLGYKVIAEGIETQEQLKMLQTMSCDIGQGYYFSKPLPADEFMDYLTKEK